MADLSSEQLEEILAGAKKRYYDNYGEAEIVLAGSKGMTLQEFRHFMMGMAIDACEDSTLAGLCKDIPVDVEEPDE